MDMMAIISIFSITLTQRSGFTFSHRVLIRTRLKMYYFDIKCVCFQSAYTQYALFNILFYIEILHLVNLRPCTNEISASARQKIEVYWTYTE